MVNLTLELWQRLVESLPVGLLIVQKDGIVLYSNSEAAEMLGTSCAVGSKTPIPLPPGQHQVPGPSLESGPLRVQVRPIDWNGQAASLVAIDSSDAAGWTSHDTEQLAYEDPLTGLPNLNILNQFIEFTCTQANRYQRSAALILLDVDDFRGLKRQLGEAASDELLLEIAGRLQHTIRSSDLVGRRSHDQFLVLLTELTNDRSKERAQEEELSIHGRASRVAERILREFEVPFRIRDIPITCRLSLGLTVCPQEAQNPEDMLLQADLALLHAKQLGGERYVVYSASLQHTQELRHSLAQRAQQALKSGSLTLALSHWYNPTDQSPLAAQLQVQFDDAGRPVDIWAVAEREGFAPHLLEWVLENWPQVDYPLVLPLTSTQLLHRELPNSLPASFASRGLDPHKCLLLCSESALLQDPSRRTAMLHALRSQGFAIVLDIPSHGVASLQWLQQLRPDWLKIASNHPLSEILAEVAHSLHLRLVLSQFNPGTRVVGPAPSAYSLESSGEATPAI